LVDDNMINLKILMAYMSRLGHTYATASNGKEAYDVYTRTPGSFQYVLIDMSMPVMDGFEASRLIRAFEREQRLRPAVLIALTGLASAAAQQDAFASGINLFLTKPVRLKELTAILRQRNAEPQKV
jgi:CheY-like chemotaxis protein